MKHCSLACPYGTSLVASRTEESHICTLADWGGTYPSLSAETSTTCLARRRTARPRHVRMITLKRFAPINHKTFHTNNSKYNPSPEKSRTVVKTQSLEEKKDHRIPEKLDTKRSANHRLFQGKGQGPTGSVRAPAACSASIRECREAAARP